MAKRGPWYVQAETKAVASLAKAIELLEYYEKARTVLERPGFFPDNEHREKDLKRARTHADLNIHDAQRGFKLAEEELVIARDVRARNEADAVRKAAKKAGSKGQTYDGGDIARMHDDVGSRYAATIKGISVEVKRTPGRRGRGYDSFDLYINGAKVWGGEATDIVPLNVAGGTIEAFVLHGLERAGVTRSRA